VARWRIAAANLDPTRQRILVVAADASQRTWATGLGQPVRYAGYWFFKSDFIFSSSSSNDIAPLSLSPLMKKVGVASTFSTS
jgi:hypothetical protein